jgi:hypothetical protein
VFSVISVFKPIAPSAPLCVLRGEFVLIFAPFTGFAYGFETPSN